MEETALLLVYAQQLAKARAALEFARNQTPILKFEENELRLYKITDGQLEIVYTMTNKPVGDDGFTGILIDYCRSCRDYVDIKCWVYGDDFVQISDDWDHVVCISCTRTSFSDMGYLMLNVFPNSLEFTYMLQHKEKIDKEILKAAKAFDWRMVEI